MGLTFSRGGRVQVRRTWASRLKVIVPAFAAGAVLSACAAFRVGTNLGWRPAQFAEVWASVLAGPISGLWAYRWGPADAFVWAFGCGMPIIAHPIRPGWLTGTVSAMG